MKRCAVDWRRRRSGSPCTGARGASIDQPISAEAALRRWPSPWRARSRPAQAEKHRRSPRSSRSMAPGGGGPPYAAAVLSHAATADTQATSSAPPRDVHRDAVGAIALRTPLSALAQNGHSRSVKRTCRSQVGQGVISLWFIAKNCTRATRVLCGSLGWAARSDGVSERGAVIAAMARARRKRCAECAASGHADSATGVGS